MQIDVPESKAKVLMLIAELAKAGQNKLWGQASSFVWVSEVSCARTRKGAQIHVLKSLVADPSHDTKLPWWRATDALGQENRK